MFPEKLLISGKFNLFPIAGIILYRNTPGDDGYLKLVFSHSRERLDYLLNPLIDYQKNYL